GVAIRAFIFWVQSMEQLHVIQQEKLKTELAFLRSQMNPHFLFNTINLVFGSIEKTNSTARDIMVRFSELLRYQLYECDVAEIPLEKEINYLRNYIELQKKRKADELTCTLKLPEKINGYSVSPLLMAPLVENAFKYVGPNSDKDHYVYIELKQDSGGLLFTCVNTRSSLIYKDVMGAHGLGLQNLRRRLELLYPNKHKLQIKESDKMFDVQLSLSL
ncbi:MAG TPA: histidine kinase, partial [Flavipsychrobacter sp.]|nr:histidine kinase [Flavipsychrobacter sp.]